MMGVLAGAKHMSHLVILKADQAIRKLFGWDLCPDASTFGKLFNPTSGWFTVKSFVNILH
jgi:hypothetical protein